MFLLVILDDIGKCPEQQEQWRDLDSPPCRQPNPLDATR
jgi:hypothetical protein